MLVDERKERRSDHEDEDRTGPHEQREQHHPTGDMTELPRGLRPKVSANIEPSCSILR